MSDLRKFCWGLFVGLGVGAGLTNHGLWHPKSSAGEAIIMLGLLSAALTVLIFGTRKEPTHDHD